MMEMMYIMGVVTIIASFAVYYWIGKALGGLHHGRLITTGIIVLFWIANSIVNAGGINNLVQLVEFVPGFAFGWIGVLAPMITVAQFGCSRPIMFLGKKKWLI